MPWLGMERSGGIELKKASSHERGIVDPRLEVELTTGASAPAQAASLQSRRVVLLLAEWIRRADAGKLSSCAGSGRSRNWLRAVERLTYQAELAGGWSQRSLLIPKEGVVEGAPLDEAGAESG